MRLVYHCIVLRKILDVFINMLFPSSHLVNYLRNVSGLEFRGRPLGRPQLHPRMFYPFYYKDRFVKDCILELKERDSKNVARLFAEILGQWIIREIRIILDSRLRGNDNIYFYLVPIPQHKNKTREKGFCHTTTLTQYIYMYIQKYKIKNISIKPCIIKITQTKKVHNTKSKGVRFKILKNTMQAHITKHDAKHSYFFLIDDVYTTGATFKEAHRSLADCGVSSEHMYFISIAH